MGKVKVSVCVPVYNAEKYLRECLESLVNQTLKEIEIICVDDGSTDGSSEILNEYANKYKNIKVIHQENKGLGATRDVGIKNTNGEYIGFLDADDIADKNMYKKLYDLANKKSAEIAFCNLSLFPSQNTKKRIWFNPYQGELNGKFLYRNTQPWNKIFSRNLFERTGLRFKKNDSICILLMITANGIVSTDEKLYRYRVGHNSMSTNYKMENFADTVETVMWMRKEISKEPSLDNTFGDYFDFLIINALIRALVVSVLKNNRVKYDKWKKILKEYEYKSNKYCKKLLKPEQGSLKYFAIMNILPNDYRLSRFLICNVLGGDVR